MWPTLLTWRNAKLLVLACLLSWGCWGEYRVSRHEARIAAEALKAADAAATASENARETERLASRANTRIADDLLNAQKQRDAAARSAAQRLRELAEARSAADATASACQRYDGAPVDVLPGPARAALVELATDADEVTDQLRACQAYVRDVVSPEGISNAPK